MRNILLPSLALILIGACSSSNNNKTPDAPISQTDAATSDGAAPAALDCASYCGELSANCKGDNAQYPSADQCMTTCAKMTEKGSLTDTSGNTLGCRIYHGGAPSVSMPEVHCIHAGPAGMQVNATAGSTNCGDPCTDFCTLNLATCTGTLAQYSDMNACMTACNGDGTATHPGFNKTELYKVNDSTTPATTPSHNSLACRIYHTTNAAVSDANATTHCKHTAETPVQACVTPVP
jgi:hypothetical protein